MTSNKNYFDQVGAFLDNELKGDELARFNEELTRNPDLVKELNYQKELIDGIKSYRHAELKARLDAVPIGSGFWSGTAVKVISGAVIVAGIGFGIYELLNQQEKTETDVSEEIELPEPVVEETTPLPEEITPATEEEEAKKEQESITDAEPDEIIKETAQDDESLSNEIDTPAVPTPESFEMEDPTEEDLELPESTLGIENQPIDSNLEIEIVTDKRRYPLHYQVIEGRLLLYGDFDEEPYELLEINVSDERKLYLFFKEKYYEIEKEAQEITPLKNVSNKALIKELEKIKNKNP